MDNNPDNDCRVIFISVFLALLIAGCEVGYRLDTGNVNSDVLVYEDIDEASETGSGTDTSGDASDIHIDRNTKSGNYYAEVTLHSSDGNETLITPVSIPVIFPEGRDSGKPVYFYQTSFCTGVLQYEKYVLDENLYARIDIGYGKECDFFLLNGYFQGDIIKGDCRFYKNACLGGAEEYKGEIELKNRGEIEYSPQIFFAKKYLHPFDILHLLPNFPVDMDTLRPQILIDGKSVQFRIEESDGIKIIPEEPLWFNRDLKVLLGDVKDILGKKFEIPATLVNIKFYNYIEDLEFNLPLPKHSYSIEEYGNNQIKVKDNYLRLIVNNISFSQGKGYASLFFGKRSGNAVRINMKFEPKDRTRNVKWYIFSDRKIYGPNEFSQDGEFQDYLIQTDGEDNYYFLFEYDTFLNCANDNFDIFDYQLEIDYVRFE